MQQSQEQKSPIDKRRQQYYNAIVNTFRNGNSDVLTFANDTMPIKFVLNFGTDNNVIAHAEKLTNNGWFSDTHDFTYRQFIEWVFRMNPKVQDTSFRKNVYLLMRKRITLNKLIQNLVNEFQTKMEVKKEGNYFTASLNDFLVPTFLAQLLSELAERNANATNTNRARITVRNNIPDGHTLHQNNDTVKGQWTEYQLEYMGMTSDFQKF